MENVADISDMSEISAKYRHIGHFFNLQISPQHIIDIEVLTDIEHYRPPLSLFIGIHTQHAEYLQNSV